MTLNKSIAVAIATGSLLLNAFATTAFADTTVTGNGADSSNTVTTTNNSTTEVQQSNNAVITNNVQSSAKTGENDANYNTGGSTSVNTGGATTTTQVSNAANLNQANVSCGCTNNPGDVTISGNGANSGNSVNSNNSDSGTTLVQGNNAVVTNNVSSEARTGENNANYNTGGNGNGSVTVQTGAASTTTGVNTMANANVATIGSGTGTGTGTSAVIDGNGAYSNNKINLNDNSATLIWQKNNAVVTNNVDSSAKTGNNNADYNTNGDVTVQTGAADNTVAVDNEVNFNAASVDCGCFTTTGDLLKLAGNGADSHNTITDNNGGGLSLFQGGEGNGNNAILTNGVNGDSRTGENGADDNTGAVTNDPTSVMTGASSSQTGVSNAGNVNLYGTGLDLSSVNLSFDLSGLLGMFGM